MKIVPTKSQRQAMKRTRVTLRNANNRDGKSQTFTVEGVSMRDIKNLLFAGGNLAGKCVAACDSHQFNGSSTVTDQKQEQFPEKRQAARDERKARSAGKHRPPAVS